MGIYRATYDRSLADPEAFWRDAAEAIDWRTTDDGAGPQRRARSTGGSPTGS